MTKTILEFLLDEKSLAIITGVIMVIVSSIILILCRNGENNKKYLVTVVADFIVLLLSVMMYFIGNNYVVVPEITHLNIAEAKVILNSCDLNYNYEDFLNHNNEMVINCVPGVGEIVKKGSVIYLNAKQPHITIDESSQNGEEINGEAIPTVEEITSEITESQTTKEDVDFFEETYRYDTDYSTEFNTDTIKLYLSDIVDTIYSNEYNIYSTF